MTFPLMMPTTGASLQQFEPQRVDYISPEAGGRVGAVSGGNPLWLGVWQIGKIGQVRSDIWRAFLTRLRGPGRLFEGFDIERPFPLAHRGGFPGELKPDGSPFTGLATSWSQTIDAEGDALLTLSGVMNGLTLSLGDYIGFGWGPAGAERRRTMARVVVGGVASGGGTVTVTVEPPVPTLVVPSGATAKVSLPTCNMRLVESELGPIDRRLAITGGKITAIQDLRS